MWIVEITAQQSFEIAEGIFQICNLLIFGRNTQNTFFASKRDACSGNGMDKKKTTTTIIVRSVNGDYELLIAICEIVNV